VFKHFPVDQFGAEKVYKLNHGINLNDNLLEMRDGESVLLKNMYFRRNTPIKRGAFVRHNTESWGTEAPFKGAFEYIDNDNAKRLLFATNTGKIKEWVSASSHVDRVTGLGSGQDVFFASALGRVVSVNGQDTPRVGNKTAWRTFGAIAKVTDLLAPASGSGSFTGDYRHIVIPVKEISSTAAEIYADWSNIVKTTAASDAQFDLTWTDIVDTRIDMYWVFRAARVNLTGPYYRVARVAVGVGSYTDTTTDDDLEAILAPIQGEWGTAPIAKFVYSSGSRQVMANISGSENAFQVSKIADDTYDYEAYNDSDIVYCPGRGPITGGISIGDRGESEKRANHMFFGQLRSCWYLPDTDPKQKLINISEEVGLINNKAIAQWNSYLFWVDKKKGLMFWRVGQDMPWKVGDKIDPIFKGGGNIPLTKNQSDDDITLKVWNDQLLITVRDDSSFDSSNKVYLMDLDSFSPEDKKTAEKTATFSGPFSGPGFGLFETLYDDTLINFDNHYQKILKLDDTETQDYVDDASVNIGVEILSGPFLNKGLHKMKSAHYLYVYHFTNSEPTVRLKGEYGRINVAVNVDPLQYEFPWDDLEWDDISWAYDSFMCPGPVDWEAHATWFQVHITKDDQDKNYAFFGFAMKYQPHNHEVIWP